MRFLRLLLVSALFVVAGCQPAPKDQQTSAAPAETVERTSTKGPVRVTVRATPKKPRLSDLVQLELIVTAPTQVEVTQPTFGDAVGEFVIRKYNEKTTSADNGDRVRTQVYQLEPNEAGKHLIRSLTFEFTDNRETSENKGKPATLETEPLEIEVTTELGDATPNLADLQPIAAPMELPAKPWPAWVWAVIASVLTLAAATVGFVVYRRMHYVPPPVIKTPEQIAHEAMAALLAENLPGQGQHKEFYIRLTGIVRIYIEQTTGLHAPEQTTEEFLSDMRQRMIFSSERAERLAAFLEAADMVKYAGMQPGQRQTEEAIARAQEFVGLPSALAPMNKTGGSGRIRPQAVAT
ncbi:MAG TPA: hypothetical protein VEJ63_05300 [Planctomycetota bacterium]|nr:hypothetical protein [Planctomycetota bacterium]